MQDTYTIKLKQFEGPFDLLLFLIERDEIDIYDIPIAKINEDFLQYIKQLEELNLNVASEFILMAANLMRIKAKMLIPRKEIDEEGNEIDPREELVERLLEYKRYKSVLDEIAELEKDRSLRFDRGGVANELKKLANKALVDIELESLTMFKLLKAFEGVMDKYESRANRTKHEIVKYNYQVETQRTYILDRIRVTAKTTFLDLFKPLEDRIHAIVTFLALLDLLNSQLVGITQGIGANNFWISPMDATNPPENTSDSNIP